jgi:H/ACA ribonucleoprotein complex subunit 1
MIYILFIFFFLEIGRVMHVCEEELVCTCLLTDKVPYFNGRIFLQNKEEIGKIDEIFGPITKCVCFCL